MPLPVIAGSLGYIAMEIIAELAEEGLKKLYQEYLEPSLDFFSEENAAAEEILPDTGSEPPSAGTLPEQILLEVKELLLSMHRYYGIKIPASVTVEETS